MVKSGSAPEIYMVGRMGQGGTALWLLMSALLFGFHAAKISLPRPVCWAMVIGAFTNPIAFLLQAIFPALDAPPAPGNSAQAAFGLYAVASVTLTSYGFGRAAVIVLRSTFKAG